LIIDNGGLFNNWLPYAPYESLTVHFGFSANAAIFSWMTYYSGLYSSLVVGQIANIFAIMSIYPLAKKVTNNKPWAGIIAMLVSGLLLNMPAYYVNWGRYAQLSGQAILPISIFIYWDLLEEKRWINWKKIILSALLFAGMSLSYYRMPIYFSTFMFSIFLVMIFTTWKKNISLWKFAIIRSILFVILSLTLLLPWIINISNSVLAQSVEAGITANIPISSIINDYSIWNSINNYVPRIFLILSALSISIAIIKKEWNMIGFFGGIILLSIYKAGLIINLPGANMMQSFAVLIFLYLPICILISWLIGYLIELIPSHKYKQSFLFMCILFLMMFGVYQTRNIADESKFGLLRAPDIKAMKWINDHIPMDSVFLVEGFRIYNGDSAVGSDGGWYIPLLTKRANTMPPQYALLNETPIESNYSKTVVERIAFLEDHKLSEKNTFDQLCKWDISHVYIGQDQGLIGADVRQLFNASDLISDFYSLVYAKDRVKIFELIEEKCTKQ
jgi:hypothetical protein